MITLTKDISRYVNSYHWFTHSSVRRTFFTYNLLSNEVFRSHSVEHRKREGSGSSGPDTSCDFRPNGSVSVQVSWVSLSNVKLHFHWFTLSWVSRKKDVEDKNPSSLISNLLNSFNIFHEGKIIQRLNFVLILRQTTFKNDP